LHLKSRPWTKLDYADFISGFGRRYAPRGTRSDIIDKLNVAAVKTLTDPSIRQKLEAQGFEIPPPEKQTPKALAAFQKAEIEKWWPIIKEAGIRPQ
jgi:tripartite-type tricarboxylate transporter receptor subunit TctC